MIFSGLRKGFENYYEEREKRKEEREIFLHKQIFRQNEMKGNKKTPFSAEREFLFYELCCSLICTLIRSSNSS